MCWCSSTEIKEVNNQSLKMTENSRKSKRSFNYAKHAKKRKIEDNERSEVVMLRVMERINSFFSPKIKKYGYTTQCK